VEVARVKSLGELIEEFCRDCGLRGMTSESVCRYRSNLRLFREFLGRSGNGGRVEIDKETLRAFLEYRGEAR
jgi:site-specific recombinase XerD